MADVPAVLCCSDLARLDLSGRSVLAGGAADAAARAPTVGLASAVGVGGEYGGAVACYSRFGAGIFSGADCAVVEWRAVGVVAEPVAVGTSAVTGLSTYSPSA